MSLRIGVIGPAGGDEEAFRDAAEFLLGDVGVTQAIYLGEDDAVARASESWRRGVGGKDGLTFEARALELAVDGTPAAIEALLDADRHVQRIQAIRTLPPSPARAVEMIEDRIVVFVHDKAVLDEEDIANAQLIVFGKSKSMLIKHFGPRSFFSPGPLAADHVGVLELDEDGTLLIAVFDTAGRPVTRERVQARSAKMTVSG